MKTRLKNYEITLDVMTYPEPGKSVRVRKKVEQEAENMYAAIDLAKAKHGGKLWLAVETAESQARE